MKRFYALWLYAVLLTAVAAGGVQSFLEERQLLSDSLSRTASLAASLEDSVMSNFNARRFERISRTVRRLQAQQRLVGAAVCIYDSQYSGIKPESRGFPSPFDWEPLCLNERVKHWAQVPKGRSASQDLSWISSSDAADGRKIQYVAHRIDPGSDLLSPNEPAVVLLIARDLSYLRAIWLESFLRGFFLTLILGVALLLLVTAQMRRWLQGNLRVFHRTLRSLIAGRKPAALPYIRGSEQLSALKPITDDINQLAKILSMRPSRSWFDRPIANQLSSSITQKNLVVIANREPYIHQRKGDSVEVIRPASGLVTALEPILRQFGGLWIAHGGGSADFEVTDAEGDVAVPPDRPTYRLHRVRLSQEEEEGYYYGFSNEGLWPLCHLAHTRPIFRLSDWDQYSRVNRKFVEAIPENSLNPDSLFLVQDYHFALLPKFLKDRATRFRKPKIGLFWHIPWPNPEAFGICPWNQDLLKGMLGADVIGFHTQYHCNNFLESCNRYLEARIDYEHFSVTMGNHETLVRAFPIGIDTSPVRVLSDQEREKLKERFKIKAQYVAVGVDRIDYTKGIIERVEAVERFLERHPEYIGKFSLAQMGSPSRTHIPAYRALHDQLDQAVKRVNQKFSAAPVSEGYQPILFLPQHHEWKDIQFFYQLGDICMVTSLHDGMNLVAKEYVWCQKPERGSLILSKFTGASRELTEAFIVNPYSIEEMADAIASALALAPEEKAKRMTSMREKVHTRNAYRWASELIDALIRKNDNAPAQRSGPDRSGRSKSKFHAGTRLAP